MRYGRRGYRQVRKFRRITRKAVRRFRGRRVMRNVKRAPYYAIGRRM